MTKITNNVELTDSQIHLIAMALETRLRTIEHMIRVFEDGTEDGEKVADQYIKEGQEVEALREQLFMSLSTFWPNK